MTLTVMKGNLREGSLKYHMVCVTSVYRYNQVNAITMACKTGVKGCSELTRMWYRQWMKNPGSNPYGNRFSLPEI